MITLNQSIFKAYDIRGVVGKTLDATTGKQVPSVLLVPSWVTAQTIEKTVVADNFVPASQICTTAALQADCTTFGIH